jgi:hypothetical protein
MFLMFIRKNDKKYPVVLKNIFLIRENPLNPRNPRANKKRLLIEIIIFISIYFKFERQFKNQKP